ncbi:MAG: hypothetical protein WCH00_01635 [Candidatus Saccharibacteria bacterium]
MEKHQTHHDHASEYFKKEINQEDISKSAHYTFRDGFRLGFGVFVGLLLGSVIMIIIVYALNYVFHAL